MSYCKIICMGRLTRDPDLRSTPQGTPVCDFGIAFDNGWGDNKRTCFVDVTVWGKQAEFVKQYFRKGSGVHLDGRLELDTWDDKNSGDKRRKHYIVADRVTFPVGGSRSQDSEGSNQQAPAPANQASWGQEQNIDEIPF